MAYEVELGIQPEAFCYIHIKVTGETAQEVEAKLATEMAQLANISGAAYSTASAIVKLAANGLPADQVQVTPPAPTWVTPAPAPAPGAAPWDQAAPAPVNPFAGPPVESQGPPPFGAGPQAGPPVGGPPMGGPPVGGPPVAAAPQADANTFRARFAVPDEKWEQFSAWTKNFYVKDKNSFQKDKETKLYKFFRTPTEAQKLEIRQYAAYFGGEIVSE